jgi:hypothetical protein
MFILSGINKKVQKCSLYIHYIKKTNKLYFIFDLESPPLPRNLKNHTTNKIIFFFVLHFLTKVLIQGCITIKHIILLKRFKKIKFILIKYGLHCKC